MYRACPVAIFSFHPLMLGILWHKKNHDESKDFNKFQNAKPFWHKFA